MSDEERGLECLVGKARLVVPANLVEGMIELELSPAPPLARKWVGGLGFHGGRSLVSVSLVGKEPARESARLVKGVLFAVQDSEIGWLLEVTSVRSFVTVRRVSRRSPPSPGVPTWIGAASDSAGHMVGWVDVMSMVKELAGSA
jgi:hypothetical protein